MGNPPSATIHLNFLVFDESVLPLDADVWEEETFDLAKTTTICELEQSIKLRVIQNLQQDRTLVSILKLQDLLLVFSIKQVASNSDPPDTNLTKDRVRLRTISDFFDDSHAPDQALYIPCEIDVAYRPQPAERQPDRRISDVSVKLDCDNRVVHLRELHQDYDDLEYVFARFGSVQAQESSEDEVATSSPTKAVDVPANSTLVPRVQALIGYYYKGTEDSSLDLTLATVPCWNFSDYCIGDCIYEDVQHEFSTEDNYLLPYRNVQYRSELYNRLRRRRSKAQGDPDSGVPFMPQHTHNRYDPTTFGLGVDEAHADVVIMFSNKLPPQNSGTPPLHLPHSAQYRFDHEETAADIRERLLEDLQQKDIWWPEINAHTVLYSPPLRDTWELQLWVLPQPK
ncbi:uncharacterized protein LTR77_000953 [Saxophila tyrrhenica]|uniref:Uncharacterized protein n=1 Tax=Saxophila tyrrhenica TaxID=1690608 RepID=A0AAV9PTZ7_9PEZI|nr:hypothetical protein LTR77_000953 [Saxophila tyrrhenica]